MLSTQVRFRKAELILRHIHFLFDIVIIELCFVAALNNQLAETPHQVV